VADDRSNGIIEFEVWRNGIGWWSARHTPSGGTISARTREQLEHRAIGKRIGWALREAFEEQRRRGWR